MDTSFILPFFGIKIKEVSPEVLAAIESAENIDFVYPKLAIAELIARIAKECRKKDRCPEELWIYFEEFLAEAGVTLIEPTLEQIMLAIELKRKGHPDIFDCIMYAAAKTENALLLTMDEDFIDFLREMKFDTGIVITEEKFIRMVTQGKGSRLLS